MLRYTLRELLPVVTSWPVEACRALQTATVIPGSTYRKGGMRGIDHRTEGLLRDLPKGIKGRGQVRKNILEQAECPELWERGEPFRACDKIAAEVEPLEVGASEAPQRAYGVEVDVHFHQVDQGS